MKVRSQYGKSSPWTNFCMKCRYIFLNKKNPPTLYICPVCKHKNNLCVKYCSQCGTWLLDPAYPAIPVEQVLPEVKKYSGILKQIILTAKLLTIIFAFLFLIVFVAVKNNYINRAHYQVTSNNVNELALLITHGSLTDKEKSIAIHDWVAHQIAYDTEAYFSGNIISYTAEQTLQRRLGVCGDYAKVTAALHKSAGIPAKIITGVAKDYEYKDTSGNDVNQKENHTWNEVLIEDRWVIVDTCWDAGEIKAGDNKFVCKFSRKYYDPKPEVLAKDHIKISEIYY